MIETSVAEHPLLLGGYWVRAIKGGRKSQTRRPILTGNGMHGEKPSPFGAVGHRLWIRETWAMREDSEPGSDHAKQYLHYRADGPVDFEGDEYHDYGKGWRPSIHMPRWAARLFLEVLEIRCEAVAEISEEDAHAEGLDPFTHRTMGHISAKHRFLEAWDAIYGKKAPAEKAWCWACTFKVL